MGNDKRSKITLTTIATVVSLLATILTVAIQSPVYGLSIYDPDTTSPSPSPNRVDKPAVIKPATNCAMDTIENLQSFLSCLGAK
jgi:hypothetical protein